MKDFLKSFGYAACGIVSCIRRERNMRIHFVCMVYMYSFLLIYDFFEVSRTQFAVIFAANALVMMGEMVNTAVEATVNLIEEKHREEYNVTAKLAKDCAAGAVLIGAVFSVAIGIAVLWQPDAFRAMYGYYAQRPAMLAAFVISLILSLIFIAAGPDRLLGLKNTDRDNKKENK